MRRGLMVGIALAALAAPPTGATATETRKLFPGVTYTREVTWRGAGPLVLHIVRGPRPGGLYGLQPVLSQNRITGRETVTAMQRRLSRRANVVGVNGDFFNWETGHPSGIFVRRNVVYGRPLARRSSLAVGTDGLLRVDRIRFRASWQVAGFGARRLHDFNRPLIKAGVGLYTPTWGARTPAHRRAFEVVLRGVGAVRPNSTQTAVVVRRRRGGGRPIPAGGAVLQARGSWRAVLGAEARRGRTLTLAIGLKPWWDGVRAAIGGGPLLVRDGVSVRNAHEDFSTYQLVPRHPRTAVGQRANGRIILVTAEGRWRGSSGLTIAGLAREMARLGAVTAMALDGGGSSAMAFDGALLSRPSDGVERSVSDALMLAYYGVYTPPARHRILTPNGDGVTDVQRLSAKIVRRSTVVARLLRPDGTEHWRSEDVRGRGRFSKLFKAPLPMDGKWRWVVSATDASGRESRMSRRFIVNRTLGHLELSKRRMRVRKGRGGRLVASVSLANRAKLAIAVRRNGKPVRRLYSGRGLAPGRYAVVWDGRGSNGRVVRPGTFTVRAQARNRLGTVRLEKHVSVRR